MGLDRVATLYMHALHSSQLYLLHQLLTIIYLLYHLLAIIYLLYHLLTIIYLMYHLLHIMCAALQNATVTAECCYMTEVPCSAGAVCCRPHTNRAFSRQSEPATPVGWWASHVESSHNDRLQGNLPGHAVLQITP